MRLESPVLRLLNAAPVQGADFNWVVVWGVCRRRLPPSEPNTPTVDDSNRGYECAGNQKLPMTFVGASVQMLAPAAEG